MSSSSQFIGLPISVELSNGKIVEGIVIEIDQQNRKLKLGQARYQIYDGSLSKPEEYLIIDKDKVKDLTLLSVEPNREILNKSATNVNATTSSSSSTSSSPRNGTSSQQQTTKQQGQFNQPNRSKNSHHHQRHQSFETSPDPDHMTQSTNTVTSHTNKKPSSRQRQSKKKNSSNTSATNRDNVPTQLRSQASVNQESDQGPESELSAREDYSGFSTPAVSPVKNLHPVIKQPANQVSDLDLDFDFQAGLKAFDKAKLWAEIALTDSTNPEDRLVAHNRKQPDRSPSRSLKDSSRSRNLARNEMVLSAEEQFTNGTAVYATFPKSPQNNQFFIMSSDGHPIYPVQMDRLDQALTRASVECGPNMIQRIENASRSIAEYVISLMRQSQTNPNKNLLDNNTITVLIGCQGSKGSSAVRTATLLANKGYSVVVYFKNGDSLGTEFRKNSGIKNKGFEFQLRLYKATGSKLVTDTTDLPPSPAMIIEALSENSTTWFQRQNLIDNRLIDYTRCGPTMSIDTPSYTNYDTGESLIEHRTGLMSDYLICLAALPRGVLGLKKIPRKVCLADLTLPSSCWSQEEGSEEDGREIKGRDVDGESFYVPSSWGDKWFTFLNM
ncbi:hypothetical protein PPACK8108_LOCUS23492 [Phakopsora pachyrhizi]|uniref:Enhancer of mRNA-decapping protein 3 n=1 Tax=Phakopsora pachyrhizi TaxID=170000 RepID=A0AAV0BN96_PHAPC|nr:hypothetical protein PPACK8108_LOCUS23492 [Phakopsora pachyrhizi]